MNQSGRWAYFDCFCGAAGDMILGSLLSAGCDIDRVRSRLAGLNLPGVTIEADAVRKHGIAATQLRVIGAGGDQPHRHLHHIEAIIDAGELGDRVSAGAKRVFRRLADAEAAVHGTTPDKVHFHEVGAVDAIVDIVGTMIALDELGVDRVVCSAVPVGSGTVTCDHGVMPVPAPATAALLRGVPIAACDEPGELTTPTGAALLTALAHAYGPMPAMTIDQIGYGAGTREGKTRPNVFRVVIGKPIDAHPQNDRVAVIEAAIDDSTPEMIGYCIERLLEAGALDAYSAPITMKKSRPAVVLTVVCEPTRAADLESVVFAETTTLGVRRYEAQRSKLERAVERVQTPFGPIGMKVGRRGDAIITASPEYEDCRQAAKQSGAALREVMAAAMQAWRSLDPQDTQQ